MSAKSSDTIEPLPADRVLSITRIFKAPRGLLFEVWTKAGHMRQWSAPLGFTIPVSEGDLHPGGAWRAEMISPEGVRFKLGGVYREIVPNERLVFTHSWEEDNGSRSPETIVTVRFEDHPEGTRMSFEQSGFGSVESRDGHSGGWTECFGKLEQYLAETF